MTLVDPELLEETIDPLLLRTSGGRVDPVCVLPLRLMTDPVDELSAPVRVPVLVRVTIPV